jgi:hypothetical protein
MNLIKLKPIEAARKFVMEKFPNCDAALLAGSVVRGEYTSTSDLDIVVFDVNLEGAYRESFRMYGWPIEVFVHNKTSYHDFFKSDCERARPTLPRMVSEGLVLVDTGIVDLIKREAQELLDEGPALWTAETIELKRYMLTDALDDFLGSTNTAEDIFIANALAEAVHEFFLRTNGQWIGAAKWIVRALSQYDEVFAVEFVRVFELFYKTGSKDGIIELTDKVLQPHGGRLFEGFSLGKKG